MIRETVCGVSLELITDPSLFSPRCIDPGTAAMLSTVRLSPGDRLLDLGCGYGIVGIWAAKQIGADRVTMVDVDNCAVELAKLNAERNDVAGAHVFSSDGIAAVQDRDFTWILCNPPYHADFSVAKGFIEKGFNRLKIGGRFVLVAKRRTWYKKKMISVFGGVMITDISGYSVFTAEKRSQSFAKGRQLMGGTKE